MKCMNCGKETGKKSSYCDDKCKMAFHRNKTRNTVTEKPVTEKPVTEPVTVTPVTPVTPVTDRGVLTQVQIDGLPAGVARPGSGSAIWANAKEYYDTIYRLLTMTVKQLESSLGQTWIPCWRYKRDGLV